jgi:'Cold-shock' DNA-binding domain
MRQGIVKFFREDKGYGFIERDEGGTYSFISVPSMRTLTLWQKGSGWHSKKEPTGVPANLRPRTSP